MSSYTPEEIREAGLDDFRVFLRQVWDFLGLPPPTPVQNDIAKWLQDPENDRIILSAFRGVGKTWITVAFVLWNLFLDPDTKVMVVSANGRYAEEFSKFAKQLIYGMPLLQHLKPKQDQNRADLWTVGPAKPSKDPSVKSVGINGMLTGSRADIIVADDVEVPKNTQTFLLREKLLTLVTEFSAILKPLPTSRIIYLGTPQVEDSLYLKLLERGFRMCVWPAEIPQKPENYGGRLAPYVQRRLDAGWQPGQAVDPVRFNEEVLRGKKAEYGLSGYMLQFMLDVNLTENEKRPLKLSNLIVTDLDPDQGHVKLVWSRDRESVIQDLVSGGMDGDFYVRPSFKSPEMEKWGGTVMAIDPSGQGSDETAYSIVRYLHGILHLVECGGFRDGFGETTLETLAYRAALHKVNHVIAEENYGGGMFTKLLIPYLRQDHRLPDGTFRKGGRVDDEYNGWSHGQKEVRILDTLEPILAQHRLVVDRRVIEDDLKQQMEDRQYSLVWQLTRMERTKGALPHEDRVESLAMACAYWVEKMDRDRDLAVQMHQKKALDDELRRFKRNVLTVGKGRRAGGRSGPLRYV